MDDFGDALNARASGADSSDPFGAALSQRSAGQTIATEDAPERKVTPFLTQIGHVGLDLGSMVTGAAGNLADVVTGTYPGKGSHAESWTQWAKHEPDYVPETDPKIAIGKSLPKVDPYNILPNGPFQDEMRERVPQAAEAISTVIPGIQELKVLKEAKVAARAASAIEEGHPLTAAAKSEAADMKAHVDAAKNAGVDIPDREISPAQQYMNDAPRKDLGLPKNAPITDGLLDAADKQKVGPAYEAVKKSGTFELGPKYQDSIGKVNTSLIDKEFRPPESGTMTGQQAVEMSSQLRSVAKGLYGDAENMNLTYAERQAARKAADAHYQAAKAVEGGFREGAGALDASESKITGKTSNANTKLADDWDAARVYKAKLEAWRSTLDGAGNVIAPKLKKMLADDPITGPMKEAASVAAQAPEQFRSTRISAPSEGLLKKGVRNLAPIAGASLGTIVVPGPAGAAGGAALGENLANKLLGPSR